MSNLDQPMFIDELSAKKREAYNDSYHVALGAVDDAIDFLEDRLDSPFVDEDEEDEIPALLQKLKQRKAKLRQIRKAVKNKQRKIRAPDAARIKKIKSLSTKVDDLNADQAVARAGFDLAKEAVVLFTEQLA